MKKIKNLEIFRKNKGDVIIYNFFKYNMNKEQNQRGMKAVIVKCEISSHVKIFTVLYSDINFWKVVDPFTDISVSTYTDIEIKKEILYIVRSIVDNTAEFNTYKDYVEKEINALKYMFEI